MRIFKQSDTGTFIQFELGKDMYYLGDCIDLDTIPNPRFGGIDLIQCWNRSRTGFNTLGSKKKAPGNIEVKITDLYADTASWLEKMAATCPFTLYALQRDCGDADVPSNWVRGSILYNAEIIGDELGNVASHTDENEMTKAFSIIGWPPRVDVRRMSATRQTTAGTTALNAVAALDILSCGVCAPSYIPGNNAVVGSDRIGGAAPMTYEKYLNAAWTVSAAAAFAAEVVDVMALAMFQTSSGVMRILAVRGTLAATKLEVSYSDDHGVTWTLVSLTDTTAADYCANPKALCALDSEHIWLGTSAGTVLFSSDGGVTWVNQDTIGVFGANAINAISFADEDVGVAVGAADKIMMTIDGGEHWVLKTATGSAVALTAVQCFDKNRILVGTAAHAAGTLYITFDGTAHWATRNYPGFATHAVKDMDFFTPGIGILVTNVGGVGHVHQTIDGGFTWQEITTIPTNTGLNSGIMYNVNGAYVVGEVVTGTGLILNIGG